MPFFSVIVPVYNAEQFLRRAIDSILNQTFSDFEIVLVDDGSTDRSREIAMEYTDPRLRRIFQENRGEGGARNRGIDEARGTWIAFLDADDDWHSDLLETFAGEIRQNPDLELCYGAFQTIDNSNQIECRCLVDSKSHTFYTDCLFDLWCTHRDAKICIGSATVRRDALDKTDHFPVGMPMGADRHFWMQVGFVVNRAVYISKIIVNYRIGIGVSQSYYNELKKGRKQIIYPSWLQVFEEWDQAGRLAPDRRSSALAYLRATMPVTLRNKGYQRAGGMAWQILNRYISPFRNPVMYLKCFLSFCLGVLGSFPTLRRIAGALRGLRYRLMNRKR